MTEEQAKKELQRCMKAVFDAVQKGRFRGIMREASYVETLANMGVPAYVKRVNEQERGG